MSDLFTITISAPKHAENLTKRIMLSYKSDKSRMFDALGWFAPAIICMKILIELTWEQNVDWDEQIPEDIKESWKKWRSELPILANIYLRQYLGHKTETADTIRR